jgi:hypothetical protein
VITLTTDRAATMSHLLPGRACALSDSAMAAACRKVAALAAGSPSVT